jgi:hypothetical protein
MMLGAKVWKKSVKKLSKQRKRLSNQRNDSRILLFCRVFLFYKEATHSRGVMPVTDLKLRKKDASVLNPDAEVIATIFMSGCCRSKS